MYKSPPISLLVQTSVNIESLDLLQEENHTLEWALVVPIIVFYQDKLGLIL